MYIGCETPALPFTGVKVSATVLTVRMPPPCWLTVVSLPLKIARRVHDTPGNHLSLRRGPHGAFCMDEQLRISK